GLADRLCDGQSVVGPATAGGVDLPDGREVLEELPVDALLVVRLVLALALRGAAGGALRLPGEVDGSDEEAGHPLDVVVGLGGDVVGADRLGVVDAVVDRDQNRVTDVDVGQAVVSGAVAGPAGYPGVLVG